MVRPTTTAFAIALIFMGAVAPLTAQDVDADRFIDFGSETAGSWFPVNDGVMGGRSASVMRMEDGGVAVFEGNLSLENNGGFASIRTEIPQGTLAGYSRLLLRVRGDGKAYQVRMRMATSFDGVAYGAGFPTVEGEWTTIAVPLSAFEPTFRGYRPRDAAPLSPADVRQIGIMLTDKQEGPFRLEVAWIGADRGE